VAPKRAKIATTLNNKKESIGGSFPDGSPKKTSRPKRKASGLKTRATIRFEVFVSRPAEELLEFDRLKGIVSRSTTCVPGRRAIEALAPQQDAAALEAEFELVREAVVYLRGGFEMGFGSLADSETWLARLAVPGSVLLPAELLDAAILAETADGVRQTFKGEGAKYPRLAERAAALADLRHLSAAIRRAVMPSGEISDDASQQLKRIRASIVQARGTIHRSLEGILRARGAERALRDSCACLGPARRARSGPRGQRHGADDVRRTARSNRSE
jgi:dsDNA-specific endonuclease/ATPase MutS2